MKSILIVISEYGALAYFYPVIKSLLKNYQVTLFTELDLSIFIKKDSKKKEIFQRLDAIKPIYLKNETIKNFNCIISSATSNKFEHEIISKSCSLNIKSIQFVDNSYGWKKRLTYNGKTVFPDYLCVVHKKCIKSAFDDGIPKKIIYQIGHPAWDNIKYDIQRENRKTLFIGTPIFEIYKNKLGYSEKEVWHMCLRAKKEYPELLKSLKYLLHPSQKYPPYVNKKYIIKRIKKTDYYGQIIGIFSSYLTEAWYMNKRVISIQPNNVSDDKWIISKYTNQVYAKNYREFVNILKKEKSKTSTKIFNNNNSVQKFIKLIKSMS